MEKFEVVIAGAGPVGAVGAARLASMGISVLICEAEASCAHDLRASTLHASTLEMLDEIDAAVPLIAQGLKAPIYQMRDRRTNEFLEFDLTELSDMTRFPFRLQCEQHYMAKHLTSRLPDMNNAEVRFNTKLISTEQVGDEVIATMESDGRQYQVAAKFLIGADGSHSIVRKQNGIEFEGFTYEEKFLSLSTKFPIEDVVKDLAYVNYISDPDEWLVLLRVPAVWRILVPAAGGEDDAVLRSDERAREVFSRIVPGVEIETAHRAIYRVHQRVAKTFVKGRITLVGDAAHLNNPLGGFGMNSGVHDVWNLADKLWKILRKDGDMEQLALFDRQRRTTTIDFIQAQSIQNKTFMEQGAGEAHRARQEQMLKTHSDPELRRQYLLRQAMFKSLYDAENVQ